MYFERADRLRGGCLRMAAKQVSGGSYRQSPSWRFRIKRLFVGHTARMRQKRHIIQAWQQADKPKITYESSI